MILLDPGHGGVDVGAIGKTGLYEADVNLAVALTLKYALAEYFCVPAALTRTRDIYVSLGERVEKAREIKATKFISIHCNAATKEEAHGTEIFYNPAGKPLAEKINKATVEALGITNRGLKTANLYVTRNQTIPAVLLELAFISNASEEKLLRKLAQDREYRLGVCRKLAQAII